MRKGQLEKIEKAIANYIESSTRKSLEGDVEDFLADMYIWKEGIVSVPANQHQIDNFIKADKFNPIETYQLVKTTNDIIKKIEALVYKGTVWEGEGV